MSAPLHPAARAAFVPLLFSAVVVAIFLAVEKPFVQEKDLARASVTWYVLATAGAIWLGRAGAPALLDVLVEPIRRLDRRALVWLGLATFVVLLLVARLVLDAFPNSSDEYAYVLQAETYANGDLWVDAPSLPEAFKLDRVVAKDGRWISIYQPGWAALMALPVAVGLPPWSVNPIVGIALLWSFYVLSRRYVSLESAWLATLAMVSSSFFLLNQGSYFSHGIAAVASVGFALFGSRYLERGEARLAIISGLFLGFLGFTRAFNAAIVAAPFGVALLITRGRRLGFLWLFVGCAPFLLALLAYNKAVTGSPFVPVQYWLLKGSEPLGKPSSDSMTETLRRIVRLQLWTSPVFEVGWVAALGWLARKRKLDFTDWIAPLTALAFVFYGGSGGNQYGPRYYFEAWPFMILSVAKALDGSLWGAAGAARNTWAASVVTTHLAFQVAYTLPRLEREHLVVVERQDLFFQVAAAGLRDAVVIVKSPTSLTRVMMPDNLVRNGLKVGDESVTYALDLGERHGELRALFPERRFYVYTDGKLVPEGTTDEIVRQR